MSEWKPGDVAMLRTEGGERIGFRCGVASNMGWQYAREPGQNTWSSDQSRYAAPLRPLVVIDPEDGEQVARLVRLLPWTYHTDDLPRIQAALREFAAPTPPKPDEPTGLGAVVEDAKGRRWVRSARWPDSPWDLVGDSMGGFPWSSFDAVCILSEGVTQ